MRNTSKDVTTDFGKKLRAAREQRGIPKTLFAELAGFDRSSATRWEGGQGMVWLGHHRLSRFADVLDCWIAFGPGGRVEFIPQEKLKL